MGGSSRARPSRLGGTNWFQSRALIPATAGFRRRNMGNRISKAIVAPVAVLLLAASAVAIADPVAAQWRGGPGWQGGGRGSPEAMAPWDPGWGDPDWTDPDWTDPACWQVRPIYSISGAWLYNQRVKVC
jgi:hypothetical protein